MSDSPPNSSIPETRITPAQGPNEDAIPITRTIASAAPLPAEPVSDIPATRTFSDATPAMASDSEIPPTRVTASPRPVIDPEELAPESVSSYPPVGEYEVLGKLGEGGMGVVYKARQVALKRIVALKMILTGGHARQSDIDRFRIEAEAVARLQHPNIVQIYEIGENQGCPFFSLEFVEGGSLDRLIKGKPQPAAESANVVQTLARAMHYAHERGIIHRDLKPANVLMAFSGRSQSGGGPPLLNEAVPKITDFGLAKRLDDEQGQTREGVAMGTPSYMAPEQAEGRLEDIGPGTDVYALGAILYELLTGRPPFTSTDVWDIIRQVRLQEPVPPRRLQPTCPRDLETICLKALRKEPSRRYPSADEMANDLRRFLTGEPIQARPVSAWERTVKWAKRRPTQAALAFTGVLAVMGVVAVPIVISLYTQEKATRTENEYRARLMQIKDRQKIDELHDQGKEAAAAGQLALAKGQRDDAVRQLQTASESLGNALELLKRSEAPDEDLRRELDQRYQQVNELRAEQTDRLQVQRKSSDFAKLSKRVQLHAIPLPGPGAAFHRDRVRQLAPEALAVFDVKVGDPSAVNALERYRRHFDSPSAFQEIVQGCYEVLLLWAEAEADVEGGQPAAERADRARRALQRLDLAASLAKTYGLPTPQVFHVRRARYLALAGDEQGARKVRDEAARRTPSTELDFFLLAVERYRQGKFDEAARACGVVLKTKPGDFWAQYLQALCYLLRNQPALANTGFTACLGRDGDFVWALLLRGQALTALREYAAAEEDFTKALRLAENPLDRFVVRNNRGAMRARWQHWADAEDDLRRASQMQSTAYQPLATLAQVYQDRKNWATLQAALTANQPHTSLIWLSQARTDSDAALSALTQALDRQRDDAGLLVTRARHHLERGERAEARRDYEKAIARERGNNKSEWLAIACYELAHLHHQDRDYPRALEVLQVSKDIPEAHLQEATTLLARKEPAKAGEALDRYLRQAKKPIADAFMARAAIHNERREYQAALEACDRALLLEDTVEVRSLRGWVYLHLGSAQPAKADFDAVLKRKPAHADALCGRGHAQMALGKVAEAVKDGEAALLAPLPKDQSRHRLLFHVACLYAKAMSQLSASPKRSRRDQELADRYQERAVALVRDALRAAPAGERVPFWRQTIKEEQTLKPLQRNSDMLQLSRTYGP